MIRSYPLSQCAFLAIFAFGAVCANSHFTKTSRAKVADSNSSQTSIFANTNAKTRNPKIVRPTISNAQTTQKLANTNFVDSTNVNSAATKIAATKTQLPNAQIVNSDDNLAHFLPGVEVRSVKNDARIAPLQAKIKRAQIFAAYRELTQIYLQLGRYDDAARTLREEAAQYRRKGLHDAAILGEQKAARYDTDLRIFIDTSPTLRSSPTRISPTTRPISSTRSSVAAPKLARLEPKNGVYLGAFIDRDDALSDTFIDENFQTHRHSEDFAQMIGKPHASYFMYLKYGQKFPRIWVNHVRRNNAIPHIAWEPTSLNQVRDDAYLRNFAREMRRANWPIFVRFASEMNGFWTPYHGNPTLYKEKFRLVNRVLHEEAPLAATMWCVNNPPLGNALSYYPGDDGCDWVGVNFYSVPFLENKAQKVALDENPLALLDPIYRIFAARKPIAIGEYGASHRTAFDMVSRPDFAIEKMSLLYGALPRLYPRVKLVSWFDLNSIRHAPVQKTRNDYSLSGHVRVLDAYRRAIREPYFLSSWDDNAQIPQPKPLRNGQNLGSSAVFSIWAKTYTPRRKVFVRVAGKIVFGSNAFGAPIFELDLRQFPLGRQKIEVLLFDDKNRFIKSLTTSVNFTAL